jgi:uncharacterized membrane protein
MATTRRSCCRSREPRLLGGLNDNTDRLGFSQCRRRHEAIKRLEALQSQTVITIDDAAVVSWEVGKKKPKTRQLHNTTGEGALSGAFWGMFLGLIFLVPLLGAAVGAALGAWSTSIIDMGISDKFIDEVKQKVKPGTSALFLLTDDTVVAEIENALKDMNAHLIASNLSAEQEAKLREAFAEE